MSILKELERVCADRQNSRDRLTDIESTWKDILSQYEPLVEEIKALYSSGVLSQSGVDNWDLDTILATRHSSRGGMGYASPGSDLGRNDKKRRRSSYGGQYVTDSARKKR